MTKDQAKKRIKKLRTEINHHRYLYHVLNRQEISDAVLDSLKQNLVKLEKDFPDLLTLDSPTQRVAGEVLSGFKKIRHQTPMLSLNDAFSVEELEDWKNRLQKLIPGGNLNYFAEIKVDGFAVSLIYENGLLKTASTRGDGIIGENVTENVKTIESVPLRLHDISELHKEKEIHAILKRFPRVKKAVSKIPRTLEVRGEVYMTKRAFEEVNLEQEKKGLPHFANPRNIAAGSVRQLNPQITASRKLDFLAYDLVTNLKQENHEEEHLIAKLFGFKTVEFAANCKDTDEIVKFWKQVLDKRGKLPLLIDGIVVQISSGNLFEKLGVVGKAPRGAIAFKFPAKEATTIVKDIVVQVGRTGVLTPVALLEPVEIEGVVISRATLHNMDEIERLDVRIGDTVVVQRAGDVIPDIVKVLKNLRPGHARKFHMPDVFCGQKVVRPEGEVAHRIEHPEKCDPVQREKFYHFVSKKAFDIKGLGPKIINHLVEEGRVQDPADLFLLKESDVKPLERFAEKSAENLIKAIQDKKEIGLPRFIYALGILHVGEETAIDLAEHFGTVEKLAEASKEKLARIYDVGPVVTKSIYEWFHEPQNLRLLKKLKETGVKIKNLPRRESRGQKLRGKIFALTGGLELMSRDKAKEKIHELGGEISESISKGVDYLVAGSKPGSKLEKAQKLGVKIIGEKELRNIINFH